MVSYTKPRYGAMALSAFFAGVTGYVLFNDVLAGAPITTNHVLSLAALVAALASAHMAWPHIKGGQLGTGLTLGVLFLAATSYIVVASGTRNAETAKAKELAVTDTSRARNDILRMKADANFMLRSCPQGTPKQDLGVKCGLRDAMTEECGSGKGKKCDGKAYSVQTYEAALMGYDTKLAEIGPEKPASGYAHAAKVIAAVPYVSAEASVIEEKLELLLPFATVLIAEIGTIVYGHIFFTSLIRRREIVAANDHLERPSAEEMAALRRGFTAELPEPQPPTPPKPGKRKKPDERRAAVADFRSEYKARHGREPEQHEVRAALGLPRATTHRFYREQVPA